MENTRTFEVTLNVRECVEREGEITTASGAEALQMFAEVLRAYGLDVSANYSSSGKRASVSIRHPEAHQAIRLRKRGGRKPEPKDYKGVTLDWLESHSIEEGMHALGDVSRRTYYRRIGELRAAKSSKCEAGLTECNPACGMYPDCEFVPKN